MPPCLHRCHDKALCGHACCKCPAFEVKLEAPALHPVPADLTDIKGQVYFVLHQGMMTRYRAGDRDAAFAENERLLNERMLDFQWTRLRC